MTQKPEYDQPDVEGFFGRLGGSLISETLAQTVEELHTAYQRYRAAPAFIAEFEEELADYVSRLSPVYYARRLSEETGGAHIFLKREDLNHTDAHKINNVIDQAVLVRRMALLGATVIPVTSGSRTLKDAMNDAIRDWVTNVDHPLYLIGSVAGMHPYPTMVRDFQTVIGKECLVQIPVLFKRLGITRQHPDAVIACIGGSSNAIGIFHPYIEHEAVRLIGVEATGLELDTGQHAASIQRGSPGVRLDLSVGTEIHRSTHPTSRRTRQWPCLLRLR